MPFEILHQSFGLLTEYRIQNTETGEYACILPAHGAIVRHLALLVPASSEKGRLLTLIKAPASQQALLADETHASALLFPFPSRIRHGIYRFEGEAYTLPLNETKRDNSIHGFVYGQAFELTGQQITDTEAAMTFSYFHDGSYTGYPFPFRLSITYTLRSVPEQNTVLEVRYEVHNTGTKKAPLGFGWHPYFTLGEEPIDQLTIDLPVAKQITLDENLLPVGEELFNRQGEISLRERTLDAAFLVEEKTDGVTTVLRSPSQNLQLNVWQETGKGKFNYLVVYTPINRDNIAIEPLTCNVNALNNGQGLIVLQPNESISGTVRVGLS